MFESRAGTRLYVVAVCDSSKIDGKHIAEVIDNLPNIASVTVRRCIGTAVQSEPPELAPDFIVLDLCHGAGDEQIDMIRRIRQASPATHIIAINTREDDELLFQAIRAGATGHLLVSDLTAETLQRAIDELITHGSYFSKRVYRQLMEALREPPKNATPPVDLGQLTSKEGIVLEGLGRGLRPKEIAKQAGMAYETVRTHQKNIYRKLGVRSVVQAIVAVRGGGARAPMAVLNFRCGRTPVVYLYC